MTRAAMLPAALGSLILAATACGDGREAPPITASGHVEATDVRLSAKIPGRLDQFAIQEGDMVEAGQPIARIDTTDLRLTLQQATAERGQAAAELRLRVAGPRREVIAEQEARVASARADLGGAQRDLDRAEALLDRGSGTSQSRDDARTRRDIAAAHLAAQQEVLASMKAGTRVEEIDAARARLLATEARLAQLEQQIRDAEVLSPLRGIVTEKIAEPGELLAAGSGLCVVTDLDHAWLTVYLAEPDLARIRIGQEAEVLTDDGQRRSGRVTFVASKAEFTPKNVQTRDERVKLVFRVKIGLDNRDGLFKPGMPAEARLRAAGAPS